MIVTNVDRIIEILKSVKTPLSITNLSHQLKTNIKQITAICEHLEDEKIVEITHGLTDTHVKYITSILPSKISQNIKKKMSEKEIYLKFLNELLKKLENPNITLEELDKMEKTYKKFTYETLKDKKTIQDTKIIQKAYEFAEHYLYLRFIVLMNTKGQESPHEYLNTLHLGFNTLDNFKVYKKNAPQILHTSRHDDLLKFIEIYSNNIFEHYIEHLIHQKKELNKDEFDKLMRLTDRIEIIESQEIKKKNDIIKRHLHVKLEIPILTDTEKTKKYLDELIEKLENPKLTLDQLQTIEDQYQEFRANLIKQKHIVSKQEVLQRIYDFAETFLFTRFILSMTETPDNELDKIIDIIESGFDAIKIIGEFQKQAPHMSHNKYLDLKKSVGKHVNSILDSHMKILKKQPLAEAQQQLLVRLIDKIDLLESKELNQKLDQLLISTKK